MSHAAALYREKAEARFASLGLLAAAEGHQSEATKAIVDIDLSQLPALDPSHRESPSLYRGSRAATGGQRGRDAARSPHET